MATLRGRAVMLDISDPWELTAEPGDPRPRATVVDERRGAQDGTGESLLLELATPIQFRGVAYSAVVAIARRAEPLIDALAAGRSCETSVYGIPASNPPDDPLIVDWWRGGLAMNVLVRLAAESQNG
jgi:hypothetical protein